MEGDYLRRALSILVFFHCVFFVVSIVYIGFLSMISEIIFSLWAYSCYLTLKEPFIVLYLLGLIMGIIYGVIGMMYKTNINFNNMLFYIMAEVYYVLAFYYLGRTYLSFRKAGGIHGTFGTPKPKPLVTPQKDEETTPSKKQGSLKVSSSSKKE